MLKPLLLREELLRRKVKMFTPYQFEQIFQISGEKAKYFLEKESAGGLFLRLKKGLYGLRTDLPSEEEIANRLYRPSYLSFEYALAKHGILPEMVYEVTSATTKATRVFGLEGKTFSYFTIKKEVYTGYEPVREGERSYLMAEAEKALTDYLYFVVLGKKPCYDRLNISSLSKEKLIFYARLYQREKLVRKIEEMG